MTKPPSPFKVHFKKHHVSSRNQPLVFFKLNFAQACDKMNWEFLFRAMVKMGVPKKLLLKEVKQEYILVVPLLYLSK
jgi:hypothetical protein